MSAVSETATTSANVTSSKIEDDTPNEYEEDVETEEEEELETPPSAISTKLDQTFAAGSSTNCSNFNEKSRTDLKRPILKKVQTPKGVFEIPPYYEYVRVLGHGGYGVVIEAKDTREANKHVAIKQVTDIFNQQREYQKRIMREVKIMKFFREMYPDENSEYKVVKLLDLICPLNYKSFCDLYIVMELMNSDLRMLIRNNEILSDSDVKYLLFNILRSLEFIHNNGILHRDIKPSNILINPKDFSVKICDFGLSRAVDFDDPKQSTTYVSTRWYRAPELLLKWNKSSREIDVWGVGCIFAELLMKPPRHPLLPGKSYLKQLELILNLCGTPRPSEMKGSPDAKNYLRRQPIRPPKDLSTVLPPDTNPLAIDLLSKLLTFDPTKRISISDALRHEYLKDMGDDDDDDDEEEGDDEEDENVDQDNEKLLPKVNSSDTDQPNCVESNVKTTTTTNSSPSVKESPCENDTLNVSGTSGKAQVGSTTEQLDEDSLEGSTTEGDSWMDSCQDVPKFKFDLDENMKTSEIKKMMYTEIMEWNLKMNKICGDAIFVD